MKNAFFDRKMIGIYLLIISIFLTVSLLGINSISVFSTNENMGNTVIIDAGHGGIDGGAVSCTGVSESSINLDIALKLEDIMHLLGIRTLMIRGTDQSIDTAGDTISEKKISDIKNRVQKVNNTPNALLVSIHQNKFHDSQYFGAQIFYNNDGSKDLANQLQSAFHTYVDAKNNRKIQKAKGIYLMNHINCKGILIECGFLSNPAEEMRLRDEAYQKKMCCTIAATISQYLNT